MWYVITDNLQHICAQRINLLQQRESELRFVCNPVFDKLNTYGTIKIKWETC